MQKQRIMRYPCSGTLLGRMLHNARWEAPLDLAGTLSLSLLETKFDPAGKIP